MLTLSKILLATPEKIKARARQQCFGLAYKPPRGNKTSSKSGGYLVEDESGRYREFKFKVKATDGWRQVAVRFYGPTSTATKVWCWCSCPYFKYHCEVALAHKGSSSVVQSNGQRPRFTNPKMVPRVCKHTFFGFLLATHRRKPSEKPPKSKPGKRVDKKMVRSQVSKAFAWGGDAIANVVKNQGKKPAPS